MKIGAIVQARTSSTRLPNKVLKELPYGSNITVLEQVIKRLNKSQKLNEIIIATTEELEDDEIVKIADKRDVKWFRGNKENVLSRYYFAAKKNNIDIVVRIMSDCPCIDPEIIDLVINEHIKRVADYTSNSSLVRTYPHGLDVDVFNFNALEKAYKNAEKDYEKEHVIPYIYRNPHIFKVNQVKAPQELYAPDIRIVLDTEEDYALLCAVFDYLYPRNEYFNAYDITKLFEEKPWLKLINRRIVQKKIFDTLKEELEEAVKILALQDLKRARDFLREYLSKK
ncbi:glycosyltransferase family protein [Candidatus Aerophobetes bacterium]|nr:glycosyltransferase family protein [Candidatus Aerophobetes bacterium]